jgi:predicted nucleic acid-binding protein
VVSITFWWTQAWAGGAMLVIPEIADYEVRRELLRKPLPDAVRRLDSLQDKFRYAAITTGVMHKAADLWADARRQGHPTADDKALDADVIVVAQALLFAGLGDKLTVATDNVRHLSRFLDAQGQTLDARSWKDIKP